MRDVFGEALEDGCDEFALREEEPPRRGVTLHLQPERVRCVSQVIDAKSVCQGKLEGDDGRKRASDDRLVIDVDGNCEGK